VAGLDGVAADARFVDNRSRLANRPALVEIVAGAIRTKTTAQWMDALEAVGVPCGPINTVKDVFEDPQVRHRGLRFSLPHPRAGTVPQVANPIRYSRTDIEYHAAPPTLGQHTDEVLGGLLGMDAGEIESLRARGVL